MGGGSSSSNTTTNNTTNTSGSVGVQGDNAGTIISGVSGSTINTTVTDHGAVAGAMEAVNNALEAMANSQESALETVTSTNNNLKDLAMQGAANNKETLNFASTMTSDVLAKMESALTGGQSSQTNALVKVMIVLAVVGGMVFTMKAYKGK
ncbi:MULTISPECIES: hypothetical protein [Vibrio]|uniref:Uncharacterized protein n=2 Tax=Vibrio TaxID=662 RepID=F9S0Z3_9VIBR|nr:MULTISPECIES: hypothetical protein [Vibrio]EGU42976.1 hypothetical protein VII00023_02959 [Vibrio ichthyoenteri ATCC 700023]ODS10161.1 hypothetical protein VSF3289_00416 [Vibrio scophthalmi]